MSQLQPSDQFDLTHVVDEGDLASSLSADPADAFPAVFATARMVAVMELAAARLMRPLLKDGELSVGVTVDIRHTAPTPPGATVKATASFTGMEGKLYHFEVVAEDDGGEIGRGTHQRAIISQSRLVEAAKQRMSSRA